MRKHDDSTIAFGIILVVWAVIIIMLFTGCAPRRCTTDTKCQAGKPALYPGREELR